MRVLIGTSMAIGSFVNAGVMLLGAAAAGGAYVTYKIMRDDEARADICNAIDYVGQVIHNASEVASEAVDYASQVVPPMIGRVPYPLENHTNT